MTIAKDIPTNNSHATISYILDSTPHNTKLVHDRNLVVDFHNLKRDYNNEINGLYIDSQFYGVRKASGRSNKRVQAHHLIFSFSNQEFPVTLDAKKQHKQAVQADKLIKGFLSRQLPQNCQYLLGVQRDGDGGKLHVHVCVNSVLSNGRILDTNDLSIVRKLTRHKAKGKTTYTAEQGLFDNLQDYMADNFKKVTGRDYTRLTLDQKKNLKRDQQITNSKDVQIKKRGGTVWRDELASIIKEVANHATDLDDFKRKLKTVYNVDIREYKSGAGYDKNGKKLRRTAYTYTYHDQNNKEHKIRDFHIAKSGAVKGLGLFARPQMIQRVIDLNLSKNPPEAQNTANKANSVDTSDALSYLDDMDWHLPDPKEDIAKAKAMGMSIMQYLDHEAKQKKQNAKSVKNTHVQKPIQSKPVQKQAPNAKAKDHEPELVPKHAAVQKLNTAKKNTTSKKQANNLKKSLDTTQNIDTQRVQEQKQKQSEIDDSKKKEKQLKALRRAQLEQEEHNMIQNLPEPWKDNDQSQDEDGFDDF